MNPSYDKQNDDSKSFEPYKFHESVIVSKDSAYKQNVDEIIEIINLDNNTFQEFMSECQVKVIEFEANLGLLKVQKENHELIDGLFRNMHGITSISRIFKIERIAVISAKIENIINVVRKQKIDVSDEIIEEIYYELERLNLAFFEILDMYKRIVLAISNNKGRTRSNERNISDSELVLVNYLNIIRIHALMNEIEMGLKHAEYIENEDMQLRCKHIKSKVKETIETVQSMLQVPLNKLFSIFPNMTRDIANEFGKKVSIIIEGEYLEVNKLILDKIEEPIIKILRYLIERSIETPEERMSIDKPGEALLEIRGWIEEESLIIELTDDGRGLDPEKILSNAISRGLIFPEDSISMKNKEICNIIFDPGYRVMEETNELRMHEIKPIIEKKLNGKIEIENIKDEGLKFIIKIPL